MASPVREIRRYHRRLYADQPRFVLVAKRGFVLYLGGAVGHQLSAIGQNGCRGRLFSWGKLAVQDFRRLEVWQVAHELTLSVYRVTKSFPTDERFGLTSQLRRACSSIEANLAEGCGRGTDSDFSRFVQMAMGSASEAECHLLLARDLDYLAEQSHGELEAQSQRVKRMLASLLKSLNKA